MTDAISSTFSAAFQLDWRPDFVAQTSRRRSSIGAIGIASRGPNSTNAVLDRFGMYCLTLMHKKKIEPIHYSVLEGQITALSAVQGGCERIASTPVPFAYSLLLHRTALTFCLTLPFALAGSLEW